MGFIDFTDFTGFIDFIDSIDSNDSIEFADLPFLCFDKFFSISYEYVNEISYLHITDSRVFIAY
jgi:hypothetical protein